MRLVALTILVGAACGGDGADLCLSDRVMIKQGAFGIVQAECEFTGCEHPRAMPGATISVFLPPPGSEQAPYGDPIATATTDAHGFYQLELASGVYDLCWIAVRSTCISIQIDNLDTRFDVVNESLGALVWEQIHCE